MPAERALYRGVSAPLGRHLLTCTDESGIDLAMTRLYGRRPRGERVLGRAPQHSGRHVTVLGALASTGLEAVMTVDGATASDVFRAYVQEVLGPTLQQGAMVVAENRQHTRPPACRQPWPPPGRGCSPGRRIHPT